MPSAKRVKTKYPGVYYLTGGSKSRPRKTERIYYIRYRKNGKEVEEQVGCQYQDAMTPAKAAKIRIECMTGKRLSLKEIRYRKKIIKRNQRKLGTDALASTADMILNSNRSSKRAPEIEQKGRALSETEADEAGLNKDFLVDARNGETLQEVLSKLKASEEKFRTIFENAQDVIAFVDLEGKVVEINPALEQLFGVTPEDAIGTYFFESENLSPETMQESLASFESTSEGSPPTPVEAKGFHRNGRVVYTEVTVRMRKKDSPMGYFCVMRDITQRKLAEESLKRHRDHLEKLVKERTAKLEEANSALRVLFKQNEEHKAELEEKVVSNVNELILPNLEKLKTNRMNVYDREILGIVEKDLEDIISSFGQRLSSKYYNLTSTELRIANLIKYGHTTKKISELLYLSPRTVEFHRNNIRKKLGIKNKKVNIRSHLLSLE